VTRAIARHRPAYRSRVTSAADAAALIPSVARIAIGLGVAQPSALLTALADRARAGEVDGNRLYYLLSFASAGATVLAPDLGDRIRPMSFFHGANERALDRIAAADGLDPVDLIPAAFRSVPQLLRDAIGVDTLLTTVAPMDGEGRFSLGTNTDYALGAAERAERIILEVNSNMPRVGGNCHIPLERVSAIVEVDTPLVEVPSVPPRPEDLAIGAIIAGLARDGDCLQMGIGAVPDAVCAALAGHRHLGIHTELMTPGLMRLMQSGVVDNSRKAIHAGQSVFTFAMGGADLYRFLDANAQVAAYPVDYTNDPSVIGRNLNVLSVNATLEIDIHGACNSEWIGGHQYSGAGGQLDFVRGAGVSPGGRSIIACHATGAGGTVSRIVPRLSGPVTVPRNDVHMIVTEYGCADLRGLSLAERRRALIGLAHPRFRDALAAARR